MYQTDLHKTYQESTKKSADIVAQHLKGSFELHSVLDVGCGHGDWLKAFVDLGVGDVFGCDGTWTNPKDLMIPGSQFRQQDLRESFSLGRRFDLAISTEVGEHLEERFATQYVESITSHSDLVLFGAAIPFQGGHKHLNEKWPSWWARIFRSFGYEPFDVIRPLIWDAPGVHFWYKQNLLLYVSSQRTDLVCRAVDARGALADRLNLDIVHPEKYEAAASYRSIAFKQLARNFPRAFTSRLFARS